MGVQPVAVSVGSVERAEHVRSGPRRATDNHDAETTGFTTGPAAFLGPARRCRHAGGHPLNRPTARLPCPLG